MATPPSPAAPAAGPGIDPAWTLRLVAPERMHEARIQATLLTLPGDVLGSTGAQEDRPGTWGRLVLLAGAYGLGPDGLVRPLPGPDGAALAELDDPRPGSQVLDLHRGLLVREPVDGGGLRTARFASLARPGLVVLRAEVQEAPPHFPGPALRAPRLDSATALAAEHVYRDGELESAEGEERRWAETSSDRAVVSAAAGQRLEVDGRGVAVERRVAYCWGPTSCRREATALLDDVSALTFDELLQEHRAVWAQRWAGADIEIEGDPGAQLAVRFALFHLLGAAAAGQESPVPARGLTGLAYAGHVFWDADVFVLPALAATLPEAARAMLDYRVARLPAARAAARARNGGGARFPWESADTGDDVTPTSVRDLEGRLVPIRTGEREEHINACVAWAAAHYAAWTGDQAFLAGAGRALVEETAEHWVGRIRPDRDGRGHLYGVIGPDEYHGVVDDNAFTNVMARWHLRLAADLVDVAGVRDPAVTDRWRALAGTLLDGFDPGAGVHEQFAGFFDLEPLLISEVAEPPVAADLLLGRERTARTQVVKQPDVLMLHHLVPELLPAGSLARDLDFYLPRTAHGSSLSPAICASLLARAGRPDDALPLFDLAARLDLDDLTGTTAGGLHLATMGGLWQAVVFGFAGVRPTAGGLLVDPHLPARWDRLRIHLRYRDTPVEVCATHDGVEIRAPAPIPLLVGGRERSAPVRLTRAGDVWRSAS